MYDGLDKIPIDKLNFAQLRERVQVLQDRYEMLIRRYPELAVFGGGSSQEGIDWANIVTPLINASVNKLVFTAKENYGSILKVFDAEEYPDEADTEKYDHKLLYIFEDACMQYDSQTTKKWIPKPIFPDTNRIYYYLGVKYKDGIQEENSPPPWENTNVLHFYDNVFWYYDKGSANEPVWTSTNALFWYWNGNEWKPTPNRDIVSVFKQSPAGFSLKGVLGIETDTGGKLTVSDSFIKMFPNGSNDPKIQFGYNASGENSEPVILFGIGTLKDPENPNAVVDVKGYPVVAGQGIMIKTESSIAVALVGEFGNDITQIGIEGSVSKPDEYIAPKIRLLFKRYSENEWRAREIVLPDYFDTTDERLLSLQEQIDALKEQIQSL